MAEVFGEGVMLADFENIDADGNFHFSLAKSIEIGHPYLIAVKNDMEKIVAKNIKMTLWTNGNLFKTQETDYVVNGTKITMRF